MQRVVGFLFLVGALLTLGCGGGTGPSFADSRVTVFNARGQTIDVRRDDVLIQANLATGNFQITVVEAGPTVYAAHAPGDAFTPLDSANVSPSDLTATLIYFTPNGARIDVLTSGPTTGNALVRVANAYGANNLDILLKQGSTTVATFNNVTTSNPIRQANVAPGTYTCETRLAGSATLLATQNVTVAAGDLRTFVAHRPTSITDAIAVANIP